MRFTIRTTHDYLAWYSEESQKSQFQIDKRLAHIKIEGHFGHHKHLGDDLWEIKFTDGRRIYYTIIPDKNIILIIGGNKNGQDKDIKKARNYLRKIFKD